MSDKMSQRSDPERGGELIGLQYLRFLAAFAVVYFHTGVLAPQYAWPSALPRAFGEAGVDLFFVISGFVMMHVTAERPSAPGDFLLRRFERIAPLYWGVTLIAVAVGLAFPAAMLDNKVDLSHVLLSLAFIPHVSPVVGKGGPFYGVGWTLNYEMYFYAVFAFLLVALKKPGARAAALIVWSATATVLFVLFDPRTPILRVYSNPVLLEFVAGAAVGYVYYRRWLHRLPLAGALGLAGCGAAMLATFTTPDEIRVAWQGVGAALLVAGTLAIEARGRMPRLAWLARLGDATYAIYLIHPMALTAFRVVARAAHGSVERMAVGAPLVVVMTLCAVAAGLIAHLSVERPIMRFFQRQRRQAAGALNPARV